MGQQSNPGAGGAFRTVPLRYLLWGALFGLCFPRCALLLDCLSSDLEPGFACIVQLHRNNRVHGIVDLAPLVLGWFAYQIFDADGDGIGHVFAVGGGRISGLA